ncbi:MAG: UDP-N-acetylglucosamine--LPS N-acetylglucosamine transferase [Phycisphaerales bacterium]|nr:UDP-N-acetylglucosamine--LPS N-acetylglucosamine transferase [Phycisphaerales bacterium]
MSAGRRPRVLAISSGGGHWVQLLRLRAAWADADVTYVTVSRAYASQVPGSRFRVVADATRWNKLGLLRLALQVARIVLTLRPDVVVSTGAAPGYFAIRLGKWIGSRTVWIDSIANVEQMSMTGELVRPHADLWLTQWPHLARPDGPRFLGSAL